MAKRKPEEGNGKWTEPGMPEDFPGAIGVQVGITHEIVERARIAVKSSGHKNLVFNYCGLTRSTGENFLRRGRVSLFRRMKGRELTDEEKLYMEFEEIVRSGMQATEMEMIDIVAEAARGEPARDARGRPIPGQWIRKPSWQAAMTWLERHVPDAYGKRFIEQNVRITATDIAKAASAAFDQVNESVPAFEGSDGETDPRQ